MQRSRPAASAPRYQGGSLTRARLPQGTEEWTAGGWKSIARRGDRVETLTAALAELNAARAWRWPRRRHLFVTDPHADPSAFVASLAASGATVLTGEGPRDFALTDEGAQARFVIGGDCVDKGPDNLGLLRSLRHLIDLGANVRLLAGNHDIRLLLGMNAVGRDRGVLEDHLFIRTAHKIVPILREIWDEHLATGRAAKRALADVPGIPGCRRLLYPGKDWFDAFPEAARGRVRDAQIARELARVRDKCDRFEALCAELGLTLKHVCAVVPVWKRLFLSPAGEFAWLYSRMQAAHRAGSFLFVLAGLDNTAAAMLRSSGVSGVNEAFHAALAGDPFAFYYGPLGNLIRTKYRDSDRRFSDDGAREIRKAGITAIVHGHRNLRYGQRLAGRESVLHFEADASLDGHTRAKEGIRGHGAAVTIVDPAGYVLGVSSDHPAVKVFEPETTLRALRREHRMRKSKR